MTEETNDMMPAGQRKALPAALDRHLRSMLPEKDINHFRDQLPPAFLADASEGLDKVKEIQQLDTVLQQLNRHMHKELKSRKSHKPGKSAGMMQWVYWAVMVILICTIAAYIVIRFLLHR